MGREKQGGIDMTKQFYFYFYNEDGAKVDETVIWAASVPEAWMKAGEFADKEGYADYNCVEF